MKSQSSKPWRGAIPPQSWFERNGFAQKILGGHGPPLQLGVRNCRGALMSAHDVFFVQSREERRDRIA